MIISPACRDGFCDQCDGRVVIDYDVYPCECRTCDHQPRGDAASRDHRHPIDVIAASITCWLERAGISTRTSRVIAEDVYHDLMAHIPGTEVDA